MTQARSLADDAWRALEAQLRPFVHARVRPAADADDVVQEVFLRIHRGMDSLADDDRIGPWAYQIARNAIVDHHRSRARHPLPAKDSDEQDDALAELATEDESDGASELLVGAIAAFVAMQPSPYREALTLTELQGLPHKEAAAMLGISLPALKSRVRRGRLELRKDLEACCSIALDVRGRVVACAPRPDGQLPAGCCSSEDDPCTLR